MTIRQYREREGLTKAELARRLGVNRSLITRWENGDGRPDAAHLDRLFTFTHGAVTPADVVVRAPKKRRAA